MASGDEVGTPAEALCPLSHSSGLFSVCVSHLVESNSLQPHGLSPARFFCPWAFPGKNNGVVPSPEDLPNPGVEPKSPALQADSLQGSTALSCKYLHSKPGQALHGSDWGRRASLLLGFQVCIWTGLEVSVAEMCLSRKMPLVAREEMFSLMCVSAPGQLSGKLGLGQWLRRFPDAVCAQCPHRALFILFIYVGCAGWHVGFQLPDQGLNPRTLQWQCGDLTIRPPGKSIRLFLNSKLFLILCCCRSWHGPWFQAALGGNCDAPFGVVYLPRLTY